jgi:diacylglycerol kinase (ATP)
MPDFSIKKRLKSFTHALRGAVTLVATQHNAWLHAVATVAVLSAGFWLKVSLIEWGLLIMAIALVWIAEALNTALEFLADEITEERRDRIKKAKDVAAFGVLISALAAATLGAIVFLPHFCRLMKVCS